MHARTLYIITRTQVFAKATSALAALVVLFFQTSCASHDVIEKIEEIDLNGTDPLAFTCIAQNSETEHMTRANAQALTTDFMESTYKAYNTPQQYPVMTDYHVEYKTSGTAWDGNIRPYWDYTQVSGQYAKFWDFSAFPYRFNAVAPYPANTSQIQLNDHDLTISAPYKMQQVHNGMVTPTDAEPYLVAQLQRNNDGHDLDLMLDTAKNPNQEIPSTSYTRNRYVPLPFHHINSKVRFGIYGNTPWLTANPLYIQDMTINVISPNFVTQAAGYQVTGQKSDNYSWYSGANYSGFTGLMYSSPAAERVLLRFDGGKEIPDNDLSHHQGHSSAYWLQCQEGIMQLPQPDVQLTVSFTLHHMDGTPYKTFTNVPIHLEDGTTKYTWRSGYLYTYYLIISEVEEKLEITFTATLTPWEDISGSLTTDLEQ